MPVMDTLMGIQLCWKLCVQICSIGVHQKTSVSAQPEEAVLVSSGQARCKHAVMPQTIPLACDQRDLLMAYRWPAAVVLSGLVLAGAAISCWQAHPIAIGGIAGGQIGASAASPSVLTPLPVLVQDLSHLRRRTTCD